MSSTIADDARALLALVDLSEVIVYEVAGRRMADDTRPEETRQTLNATAAGGSNWLETRCRLYVETHDADLVADFGVRYASSDPFEVSSAGVSDFVEKVGVMAVFPFLRESIQTTATRLGVPAPVLGLLRAGSFQVQVEQPPLGTASDDQ